VEDARERLLQAGLRLFAHQGFRQTSTRELAEAAQVNVASISYYFGDKAGLYRAAFLALQGDSEAEIARWAGAELSLRQALQGFFAAFLEPLRQGDAARLCMKLHFRELVEPTGVLHTALHDSIVPQHQALLCLLCRHFGLAKPDAGLQRLAVCLAALGVHLHVGRDVTDAVAPGLNEDPAAIDQWALQLLLFGLAMVQAEARRRGLPPLPEDAPGPCQPRGLPKDT
jgi:AcrR family transcriptional regulator